MEEPLCVIPNASRSWLDTAAHDVLVFRDRLLLVRGPGGMTLARESGRRDAQRRPGPRLERWRSQSLRGEFELQKEIADDRVRELLGSSEPDLLARAPSNRRIEIAAIVAARLDRGRLTCKLRLTLSDGEELRWIFHDGAMGADYAHVAVVLGEVLGPRLAAQGAG